MGLKKRSNPVRDAVHDARALAIRVIESADPTLGQTRPRISLKTMINQFCSRWGEAACTEVMKNPHKYVDWELHRRRVFSWH